MRFLRLDNNPNVAFWSGVSALDSNYTVSVILSNWGALQYIPQMEQHV